MMEEHLSAAQLYDGERNGHLEACAECGRRLSWIRVMREGGSDEHRNEPPDDLVKQVVRLGASKMRWLAAKIVFDSLAPRLNEGVRDSDLRARHLICRAGTLDFNVDLQRTKDYRFQMIGQVTAKTTERVDGVEVWVQFNDRLRTTRTDEFGEFVFPRLPATEYRITILLDQGSVMLPPFAMPGRG